MERSNKQKALGNAGGFFFAFVYSESYIICTRIMYIFGGIANCLSIAKDI